MTFRAWWFIVAVAAMGMTTPAFAQSKPIDKKVCIAAAERGQELRNQKQMRDARAQFALCSRSECPATVSRECAKWVSETEAALAMVKLEAVDGAGQPLSGVKVIVDGAPWSDEVPSEPIVLDPGSHEFRFEHPGDAPVVRTLTLAMGDRDRSVKATFGAPTTAPVGGSPTKATKEAPAPPPPPSSGRDGGIVLPAALGAVGVLGIGAAATFWILGNGELDDAKARCQAGCPASDADSAKTMHLVGDIALGVGIVALGAAAYFLITREKPKATALRF